MSRSVYEDRYCGIRKKICEYAESDDSIAAVIAIGSSTREETPADEYSDLDIFVVTEEPEKWYSGEYPKLFGNVSISFIEPTLGGGKERRCIYDEDKDVDMLIFTPAQFEKALEDGAAGWVMDRGYVFLYGEERYAGMTARCVSRELHAPAMTEEEFTNTVNDFFFHNIWAYKKLLRGELWSAKMCIDSYLKDRLLKMAEQYQTALNGADVWHDGRFLDRWLDPSVREELKGCFAHYDTEDCKRALRATHTLFAKLAAFVAQKQGYPYPAEAEACAAGRLREG